MQPFDNVPQKLQHEQLMNEWYLKYRDIESDTVKFTWDGPSKWEKWINTTPKLLFLAKEARGEYEPSITPDNINNSFGKNIARWNYVIKSFFKQKGFELNYPSDNLFSKPSETFDEIAIVEVKKLDENNGISDDNKIQDFAKKDKSFLRKQIDIINPDIILCCNTETSYDIIYDDVEFEQLCDKNDGCCCWKFDNRLVIEFWHPSNDRESHRTNEELFKILCSILKQGEVFEHFSW